jgi:hypothetical protein
VVHGDVNHPHINGMQGVRGWTWGRLEPASLTGVDLGQARLRDPQDLAELLDAHSQPYSPPLPLAAIVEEVPET